MENPTFDSSDLVQHSCIGHKEGDWIIFTCSLCKDYERRINWKTREVKVRKDDNNTISHFGSHAPVQADKNMMTSN